MGLGSPILETASGLYLQWLFGIVLGYGAINELTQALCLDVFRD